LYLYDIKIKIYIKQNSVENYMGKSQILENIFLKIFFLDWARPGLVILGWGGAVRPRKQKANSEETLHCSHAT
jgi:hypothetical protein